ncbi:hypothetical protein [Phytomonospora endophytica]|uniref:Uncharacterized protein n=1 Tax=Phytomonospora endophytica TaxID=714109 RepID=A0A841FVV1_9ACTN|nr:hypothetical protein [Phytomonospora endophytica]MBB6039914.1 hypothetical protein [Phytomonospora endophytica]GIG71016.1 hypothetical protein Pen01_73110 [Phytomonospora endophytica]
MATAFLADVLQRIDSALRRGEAVAAGADEMRERYRAWFEEAWEPGATQLCLAALPDCYEGVLL